LAQASLSNCWMVFGVQIVTYDFNRTGIQHTAPLQEPYMDEAQSYCLGISLLTSARRGQVLSMSAWGVGSEAPVALTS
jgi:hypothetical protein